MAKVLMEKLFSYFGVTLGIVNAIELISHLSFHFRHVHFRFHSHILLIPSVRSVEYSYTDLARMSFSFSLPSSVQDGSIRRP